MPSCESTAFPGLLALRILAGEAAADGGAVGVDGAAAAGEEFAVIVDEEEGRSGEGEGEAGGAEFPEAEVLLPGRLDAREASGAGPVRTATPG